MLKKSMKKLDIYIPVLFKLKDDSAIIHSTLLSHIKKQLLTTTLDGKTIFTESDKEGEFDYKVEDFCFTKFLKMDPTIKSINGYAFYYHHRLIFYAHIEYSTSNPKFRNIRMDIISMFRQLADKSVTLINDTIKNSTITLKSKPDYSSIISNLDRISIKTFYSYCVVFQPKKQSFLKANDQIQTFNIRTLQPKLMPFNRTSLLRISIPNMTAYYNGKLSTEYKSEIVNTIYKIVLYEKKIQELDITSKFESYNYEVTKDHQAITEKMILDMWSYCIDSFGGKRVDQIGNKGAVLGLIFSLIALVFSIISLITTFV